MSFLHNIHGKVGSDFIKLVLASFWTANSYFPYCGVGNTEVDTWVCIKNCGNTLE